MRSDMPQRMIIWCIEDILKKNTDNEHTMTQQKVAEKLEDEYGICVDRKTLSRNMKDAVRYIDEIYCLDKNNNKIVPDIDDDKETKYTDFFYEHPLGKLELQPIIYNLIFAKHLQKHNKDELIKKLEALVSPFVEHDMKNYIQDDKEYAGEFEEVFTNLEILDEAISEKKVVRFRRVSYQADKKIHLSDRTWYVFPLGIAAKDNDYYLVGVICGSDKEKTEDMIQDVRRMIEDAKSKVRYIDTFRVDQLRELDKVDINDTVHTFDKRVIVQAKKESLQSIDKTWSNIQDYVSQNSSLYPGRNISAKFEIVDEWDECISNALDYFGKKNVRIQKTKKCVSDSGYVFTVNTNDRAMEQFALQHLTQVRVLKPEKLKNSILEKLKKAMGAYEEF